MHWSDYLNPEHDWSDRWNPMVVREIRAIWKVLRLFLWLGYPASVLLAWGLIVFQKLEGWADFSEVERGWTIYGGFAMLTMVMPIAVSGQLEQSLPREEYEDLLLTGMPREQILAGYVHWGWLQLVLYTGLALPFMLADCWLQGVALAHALLILFACWLAGWMNCVIMVSLSLQSRVKTGWWRGFLGLHPLLLIPLTLGVPVCLLFLLLPVDHQLDEGLSRWFDREHDPVWWLWLALLLWSAVLLPACRFITGWTVRLLNRCPAK